jgi:hypothetical protein
MVSVCELWAGWVGGEAAVVSVHGPLLGNAQQRARTLAPLRATSSLPSEHLTRPWQRFPRKLTCTLSRDAPPPPTHTYQVGTRKLRPVKLVLSADNSTLTWDSGSAQSRGSRGIALRDVAAITKGRDTRTLRHTGEVKKSDEGLSAGGLYMSLVMGGGKTLDVEAPDYRTRDMLAVSTVEVEIEV